jgi:hypothetical protein
MFFADILHADGQIVQDIVFIAIFIGSVFAYAKGHVPQQTIKNLKDLSDAQAKSIIELREQVKENTKAHVSETLELNKAIADLQGQIKVYKELPLRELADGIKKVSEGQTAISDNQTKLYTLLEKSAIVAHSDTQDAAAKVKKVKEDLQSA